MEDDYDVYATLKILIIGESGVGKSSFLMRFAENKFHPDQSATIGIDFKIKCIRVEGEKIKLSIWDTAGQERFRTLTPSFYRNGQGCILVYDVTKYTTFAKLDEWLNELDSHSTKKDIVKLLVGNKIDKEPREVTEEDGLRFASKHNMMFTEASAKTMEGVQLAFEELVVRILQTPGLWEPNEKGGIQIHRKSHSSEENSCAC
ncbi:hypothetical protein HELRODRAFT_156372 [Helobdella robusta]|uniref:small monomeric GTPase n=1 Tax=Helobdella robusta TaxID=6412 RepID=T1ELU7_HELRO|nr:hypothetical protein HELRODRAFT_156372 [Helobdella robusta]ESO09965.1 hypothetical protein HELRODRAFT_156372 [Helobdella robusta]